MSWGIQTETVGMATSAPQAAPGHRNVLVVDDNAGIRRLLGRLLYAHGFTVLEASSMSEGIASVDQYPITAVILDLHLGTHSGLDLLEHLRQNPRHTGTAVLILTGSNALTTENEARIKQHRAQLFHKPISLGLLVEHIERLTSKGQPVAVA